MSGEMLLQGIEWVAIALSCAIALLLPVELWHLRRRGKLDRMRILEMLASASPLLPTLLVSGVVAAFILALYGGAAALAPFEIPITWWSSLLCVLAVDFMYYWDHHVAHENRTYWALAHSVHHSSPAYDQTTGLRISFVDGFISPWFYVPIVLIGFDPMHVLACFGFILGYQQWLHTETIGRLPRLDPWLNTPSNHRVHHGVQAQYQDRNYGAVLILWDRLFGTYEPEGETVRYGITHPIGSVNPIAVHGVEALRLWRDLRATPRWRDRLRRLWHRPDWQPGLDRARTEP
jgi:sterol desaturase/sphingolipid hydroxylase (fatty acid hydroxylase superfamily)